MTQYISTIKTQTVEVDDFDPSVVVTASGSILSDNLGIAGTGTHRWVCGGRRLRLRADIGVSFKNEGNSVTVSDFGVVYGEIIGVALQSGSIINNSGQIRSGSAGVHTEGVYLGGTDNYVLNSGDIAGGHTASSPSSRDTKSDRQYRDDQWVQHRHCLDGGPGNFRTDQPEQPGPRPLPVWDHQSGRYRRRIDRNLRGWAPEGGEFRSDRCRRIRGYNGHQRI